MNFPISRNDFPIHRTEIAFYRYWVFHSALCRATTTGSCSYDFEFSCLSLLRKMGPECAVFLGFAPIAAGDLLWEFTTLTMYLYGATCNC